MPGITQESYILLKSIVLLKCVHCFFISVSTSAVCHVNFSAGSAPRSCFLAASAHSGCKGSLCT